MFTFGSLRNTEFTESTEGTEIVIGERVGVGWGGVVGRIEVLWSDGVFVGTQRS